MIIEQARRGRPPARLPALVPNPSISTSDFECDDPRTLLRSIEGLCLTAMRGLVPPPREAIDTHTRAQTPISSCQFQSQRTSSLTVGLRRPPPPRGRWARGAVQRVSICDFVCRDQILLVLFTKKYHARWLPYFQACMKFDDPFPKQARRGRQQADSTCDSSIIFFSSRSNQTNRPAWLGCLAYAQVDTASHGATDIRGGRGGSGVGGTAPADRQRRICASPRPHQPLPQPQPQAQQQRRRQQQQEGHRIPRAAAARLHGGQDLGRHEGT